MALWQNPADGSDWVYVGTRQHDKYDFTTVDAVSDRCAREARAGLEHDAGQHGRLRVTPDGRHAGGMFPWPGAGVADVANKTWKKFGEGCYTSLTYARGPLFWYFDGAHRNVTMVDVDAGTRWMVNINGAPGFDGAEVSHPRWTNHPRFLTITGPYNQGGANQSRTGGKQTEVYLGRFSAGLLEGRGVGAGDKQRLRRFASRRLDRRRPQPASAAAGRPDRTGQRAQRRDGRPAAAPARRPGAWC